MATSVKLSEEDLPKDPRDLYVASTNLTLRALSRLYAGRRGTSESRLMKRSTEEKWDEKRKAHHADASRQALDKSKRTLADRMAKQLKDVDDYATVGRGLIVAGSYGMERLGGVKEFFRSGVLDRRGIVMALSHGVKILSTAQEREMALVGGTKQDHLEELARSAEQAWERLHGQPPAPIVVGRLLGPETWTGEGRNGDEKKNGDQTKGEPR